MSFHEGTLAQFTTWQDAVMLAEGLPRPGTTAYCTPTQKADGSDWYIWSHGPHRDGSKTSYSLWRLADDFPVLEPMGSPLPEGAIRIHIVGWEASFFYDFSKGDVTVGQKVTIGGYVKSTQYNGLHTVSSVSPGYSFKVSGVEWGGENEEGGYFIP